MTEVEGAICQTYCAGLDHMREVVTQLCACVRAYVRSRAYMSLYECVCVCVSGRACADARVCVYRSLYVCVGVRVCADACVFVYVCVR